MTPRGATMGGIAAAFALAALAAAVPTRAAETKDAGSSPTAPAEAGVSMERFGARPEDPAYGAFQRGLYVTALNLALPEAENGDLASQMLAAEIYARGLGVPRNPEEATRWYLAAAAQGDPLAQLQAGLVLLGDKPLDRANPNRVEAIGFLEASAAQGNAEAAFNLAQIRLADEPGERGRQAAAPLFRQAAEAGLGPAQYAWAQCLAEGTGGVTKDEAAARGWLKRSADQGFDTAALDYATWLAEGRGGPVDYGTAFVVMRRIALAGNVAAQVRLAKLYRYGLGTEGSSALAAEWYVRAKRAGLADPELDIFLDGLTDEERQAALKAASAPLAP